MRTWNTVIFVVWGLAALTGCSGGIVPPQPSQGETTKDKPSQGEITKSKPSQGMTLTGQIQITLNLDPPDGQTSKPGPLPRQIDDQTTLYGSADDQRADFYIYAPYSEDITYPTPDEMKNWPDNEIGPGGIFLYPTLGEEGRRLRHFYFPVTQEGKNPLISAASFRYMEMQGSTEDSPQYGTVTVYEKLPVSRDAYILPGEDVDFKAFRYETRACESKDDKGEYRYHGTRYTFFAPGWHREHPESQGWSYWPEEKSEIYSARTYSSLGSSRRRVKHPQGMDSGFGAYFRKGSDPPEGWKKTTSDSQ